MPKFACIQSVILFAYCSTAFPVTINGNTIDGFWETFALPYRDAVHILAFNTLKPLADAVIPSQIEEADQLLRNITESLHHFYDILRPMHNSSEELRQQQEKNIATLNLDRGRLESTLQETEKKISSATTELQQKQLQLSSAQEQLNQEQASLQSAQNTLRAQEHKLDRAKNCIWRGKRSVRVRRGFLKKIGKKLKKWGKGIVNAACPLLGTGVKTARESVRLSEAIVATNRQRVANAHSSVTATQNLIAQLQHTKAQQEVQTQHLARQVAEMRNKLKVISEIKEKISRVVVYLSGLFTVGQSLQSVARRLIDIAAVLEPLQEIANLVGSFAGQNSAELQASLESLRQSMTVLNVKLPQYPLDDRVI